MLRWARPDSPASVVTFKSDNTALVAERTPTKSQNMPLSGATDRGLCCQSTETVFPGPSIADLMIYLGLFLAAFLAATLVPAQSEAVLVSLLVAGYPVWALLLVASAGNVLGSVVNWWLGEQLLRFRTSRWFPVSASALERAQRRYQRYGSWSLLLSWVPIIGDPLTLAAGVMKEPLWRFLLLVTLAKVGRYLVLTLITLQVL